GIGGPLCCFALPVVVSSLSLSEEYSSCGSAF
ncbi:hypothetical protein A2U01_0002141, partial [Trifolium medium]|nr:hypothetical protein [Trifolium medium]